MQRSFLKIPTKKKTRISIWNTTSARKRTTPTTKLSCLFRRDIIFSFFIEHEVYDMIEIDIALEEHGLDCFIQ